MLDLCYHLHDEDSHNTMMELAKPHITETVPTPNKGSLRAMDQSKIEKNLQLLKAERLTCENSQITQKDREVYTLSSFGVTVY